MTRVHRTRAEQRADTRARLLASARRRFLRDGFHAASLDQIAEDAGFTIGAVYSRFSSKADLFLAVLDEHVEAIERRIARVGATSEPLAARAERVARLRLDLLQQEATWFPLVIEFWAHAARDPDLLRGFAARHQRLVDAYAGLIAADYARAGVPPPLPPGQLAVAVMAMGNGVALERLTNPGQVPDGLLATMALAFLRGLPPAAAAPLDAPAPAERRPP